MEFCWWKNDIDYRRVNWCDLDFGFFLILSLFGWFGDVLFLSVVYDFGF